MNELLFLYENYSKIIYRVSEDEGIFEICKKFNQAPSKIIKDNQLREKPRSNSLIYVEKGARKLYVVKVGDSIEGIAKAHLKSAQEILNDNCITYIFPYQIIEI